MIEEGAAIPAVSLTASDGTPFDLSAQSGPLVVYFYPKDDTSGCTREAQEFSATMDRFRDMGVEVIGISKDEPKAHRKFIDKHALTVRLASDDAEGSACRAFGVWVEKSMYGRTYMGIERSTFLFDGAGRLARVWRKVRVPGHVDAVLQATEALPTG